MIIDRCVSSIWECQYRSKQKKSIQFGGDQSIDNHSERHCTPSGRFLGNGCPVTYRWGHGLSAFVTVPDEDEVPDISARGRWNFANRLITENLSNSWHSSLTSKIDAALSNLHHQMKFLQFITFKEINYTPDCIAIHNKGYYYINT